MWVPLGGATDAVGTPLPLDPQPAGPSAEAVGSVWFGKFGFGGTSLLALAALEAPTALAASVGLAAAPAALGTSVPMLQPCPSVRRCHTVLKDAEGAGVTKGVCCCCCCRCCACWRASIVWSMEERRSCRESGRHVDGAPVPPPRLASEDDDAWKPSLFGSWRWSSIESRRMDAAAS